MTADRSPSAAGPPTPTNDFPPLAIRAQLRWALVRPIVQRIAPVRTIEVGVGQGAMGARIAAVSGSYVGVEIDADSARRANVNIAPHGGVVYNEPLSAAPRERSDLLCAFEVLEHIEDDRGALVEWLQCVSPGGHLLLSVPANPKRYGPMDEFVGHFRRYSREGLTELLTSVGLDEVDVRLYGSPLGYLLEAVRNRIDAKKLAQPHGQSMEELTKASGRTFQFGRRSWFSVVTTACVLPFVYLQRVFPGGVGLVAVARKP
jgi:SAM-dependent methyltransferase